MFQYNYDCIDYNLYIYYLVDDMYVHVFKDYVYVYE